MIAFYFQLLIPLALVFYRFPRRKHFLLRVITYGLGTLALSALWYSPTALVFLPDAVNYFLYYIIAYAFCFFYCVLCFDMPLFSLLFYVAQAFIVQNLSHHIFELLMRLLNVAPGLEYDKVGYLLILAGVYCVVYSLFFFFFVRWQKRNEITAIPKVSLAIASVFFFVMIVLGIYVRHIKNDVFSDSAVALGYEIYSTILAFFILSMQLGVFNIGKLKQNKEELEQQMAHESKYYKIAQANMDEINLKCHDLKHQISNLRQMDDSKERQIIISDLEKSVLIYDNIAKTGNKTLDCVLTEKGIYCGSNDINFTMIADGRCLNHLKSNDIWVLLGNIFDNAIESVMKVKEKEKRFISLKISERGGMSVLNMTNYCASQPEFSQGLPITTKSERGHGYGFRSIRHIVEKYGGNLKVCVEHKVFSVDILLPLP